MPVCLFDGDQQALQVLGIVIGIVERHGDVALLQRCFVDDGGGAVDPSVSLTPGMKKSRPIWGLPSTFWYDWNSLLLADVRQ